MDRPKTVTHILDSDVTASLLSLQGEAVSLLSEQKIQIIAQLDDVESSPQSRLFQASSPEISFRPVICPAPIVNAE